MNINMIDLIIFIALERQRSGQARAELGRPKDSPSSSQV